MDSFGLLTMAGGLALFLYGMKTMGDALSKMAGGRLEQVLERMTNNPVKAVLLGAGVTAVIQSSSASVGILQAMCVTGSVSVGAALPVIMGQNIGTCVTALLSGVGANKNARRASLVHLYFNLVGTFVFMAVFYAMDHFVQFAFLSDAANGAVIAVIHSVFNIASTIVLLPASRLLVKLAYFTIPQSEDETLETSGKVLDDRFLERPAFAVAQCKNAVCDMAQLILKAMNLCVYIQKKYDENAVQEVMEIEQEVDVREDELSSYLAKLSTKPLSERDSKTINKYSRCITDFERISDYTKGIAFAQKKLHKGKEKFSRKAAAEARLIYEASLEIVECTVSGFIHEDKEMAFRIDPLADVISRVKKEIRKNHSRRLEKGKYSHKGMADSRYRGFTASRQAP